MSLFKKPFSTQEVSRRKYPILLLSLVFIIMAVLNYGLEPHSNTETSRTYLKQTNDLYASNISKYNQVISNYEQEQGSTSEELNELYDSVLSAQNIYAAQEPYEAFEAYHVKLGDSYNQMLQIIQLWQNTNYISEDIALLMRQFSDDSATTYQALKDGLDETDLDYTEGPDGLTVLYKEDDNRKFWR